MLPKELAIELEYAISRKAGEYELKRYLREQQHQEIEDVSENPNFWYKDIDLINHTQNSTIEVKWDGVMNTTHNVFIETCSNIDSNKEGWFLFCQADYLYYGDAYNKVFYIFDFQKLKAHIEAHKNEYKIGKAADYNKQGIKKWSSGYLVPISTLQGLYTTIDVSMY